MEKKDLKKSPSVLKFVERTLIIIVVLSIGIIVGEKSTIEKNIQDLEELETKFKSLVETSELVIENQKELIKVQESYISLIETKNKVQVENFNLTKNLECEVKLLQLSNNYLKISKEELLNN